MSMYRRIDRTPLDRVHPEKVLPRLPVFQPVYRPEARNPVDMTAKAFDFFVKKAFLLRVDAEVKLDPAPVQMPVAVHHPAFRAAETGPAQHLQHPDRRPLRLD